MKKSVFYKKKFCGGRGCTFSGPPIRLDVDANKIRAEYDPPYCCDIRGEWLPVPSGFVADETVDDDDPFRF